MIYTIDTIPAKTFFKIQQTGDLTLLSNEKKTDKDLQDTWLEIVKKDQEITGSNNSRIINLVAKIERLKLEFETVSSCIAYLKKQNNKELKSILVSYGYTITKQNFKNDLKIAEQEALSINIRISRFESELKRLSTSKVFKKQTFEDVFIPILAILEIGYVSANKVTLLEFRSLEKQAVKKIESLQKQK